MLLVITLLLLSLDSSFSFEGIQVLRDQPGWHLPGVTSQSLTAVASWRRTPEHPGAAGQRIRPYQVSKRTVDLEDLICLPVLFGKQPYLRTFEIRGQLHFEHLWIIYFWFIMACLVVLFYLGKPLVGSRRNRNLVSNVSSICILQ